MRPIIDGLRVRFDVSVSETDHADAWQRCEIGVALVSGDVRTIERLGDEVERFVWTNDVEVLEVERRWLEADR